ncbi:MAG TPA: hypothetical protein VEY11_06950 [Pyrinomonadaceae bacterium]|nr:hypothetical protein [Pyrinomonadaceae bacterium]
MKAIFNVFRPARAAKVFHLALVLSVCAVGASAQTAPVESGMATATPGGEPRVALTEAATAYDAAGRVALGGRLRTTALAGTQDAPTRNVLVAIENRSGFFYNYVSGSATFYDTSGVRCGEGMWKVGTLAVGEVAEVDTPGLRLTCTPTTWRIVAINLLTRSTDVAKPDGGASPAPDSATPATAAGRATPATPADAPAMNVSAASTLPRLEININGRTLPLQIGNPIEIVVGNERVSIVVNPAP